MTWPPAIHGDVTTRIDGHAADTLLHSSGQEAGFVANQTGTAQVLSTTIADVTGMALELGAQTRPLWLSYSALIDVTAIPTSMGAVIMYFVDEAGTTYSGDFTMFTTSITTGAFQTVQGETRIGTTAGTKTFRLRASLSGGGFGANIFHGTAEYRTWMTASLR